MKSRCWSVEFQTFVFCHWLSAVTTNHLRRDLTTDTANKLPPPTRHSYSKNTLSRPFQLLKKTWNLQSNNSVETGQPSKSPNLTQFTSRESLQVSRSSVNFRDTVVWDLFGARIAVIVQRNTFWDGVDRQELRLRSTLPIHMIWNLLSLFLRKLQSCPQTSQFTIVEHTAGSQTPIVRTS